MDSASIMPNNFVPVSIYCLNFVKKLGTHAYFYEYVVMTLKYYSSLLEINQNSEFRMLNGTIEKRHSGLAHVLWVIKIRN